MARRWRGDCAHLVQELADHRQLEEQVGHACERQRVGDVDLVIHVLSIELGRHGLGHVVAEGERVEGGDEGGDAASAEDRVGEVDVLHG